MYNLVFGLDISKSTLDVTCVRFAQKQHFHDAFLNKKLGFTQLLKWMQEHQKDEDQVLVCMEYTGYYGHKLLQFLRKHTFDVSVINPLKIKRSMGLRREKSDKADSKIIALYGLRFQEEISVNSFTDKEFLQLQLLLTHRKRIQDVDFSKTN